MTITREALVDEIVENARTGRWINCTYIVEGKPVGVKAFGKWVQRLQIQNKYASTVEVKTKGAFRLAVTEALDEVMK